MFLSFIIPIYNGRKYLEPCLKGLYDCGLDDDDYEIILIDDASTEDYSDIMAKHQQSHQNLFIFRQNKQGPSTARENGLKRAQGEYIWFVDIDDTIVSHFAARLKQYAKDLPDAVSFNYKEIWNNRENDVRLVESSKTMNGIDYLKSFRGGFLWNKIFKRNSITIPFLEGIVHIEDMCFNVQNIIHFQRIVCIPEIGYLYNRRNVSSTSHNRSTRYIAMGNMDAYQVYQTLYSQMTQEEDFSKKTLLLDFLNFGVAGHLFTMMNQSSSKTIKRYIGYYKKMGLYPVKKGKNKKANRFLLLANHEKVFLGFVRLYRLLKK